MKPARRMKELKNTVVHVKTQAEYDELMKMYEEAGWKWRIGSQNIWHIYKDKTYIRANDRFTFGYLTYLDDNYKILTLQEFKEIQNMKYKQGDILVDNYGDEYKILGVCGEAYFLGYKNNFCGSYTQQELDKSYTLKSETIDILGKTYKRDAVEERLKELEEE